MTSLPILPPRPVACVKADEFWSKVDKTIFVSATPGKFELELATLGAGKSGGLGWDEIGDLVDAQAVIRPTGITDPPVDIRPSEGQVSDMVQECKTRGGRGERVLVTALTKQMAGEVEVRGVPPAKQVRVRCFICYLCIA